jgi:uncharacterized membrane-anchored protein
MRVRRGRVFGLLVWSIAGLGLAAAGGGAWASQKHKRGTTAADDAKTATKPSDATGEDDAPAGAGAGPKYKTIAGPQKVDAGHDVMIDLPTGYLFLDAPQAKQFMEKLGNLHNENLLGILAQPDSSWVVTVRFTEDGYVKDDEAEKMDADEILKTIREGTDAANEERVQRGFKAMHVIGWSEPPRYQRDVHHLVWGIRGQSDGESEEVINFNTRVLGRKGFVSLNLIDGAHAIEASKPAAAKLLEATTFKAGSRYQDFNSKTDKVAEYGLAALVVGGSGAVALKLVKVGLLAKFGGKLIALLVALKKGIVLVLLAIAGFFKKLFGRKKEPTAGLAVNPNLAVPNPAAPPSAVVGPPASGPEQGPTEGGPGGQQGT